jgi:hypothetical protein
MERAATIDQSKDMTGIYLKSGVYLPDGRPMISALMESDAEQMQAVKMAGLRRKYSVINFFGICQSAGVMQR